MKLGRELAPDLMRRYLDRRVVEKLLDLGRGVVKVRLQHDALLEEVRIARERGAVS